MSTNKRGRPREHDQRINTQIRFPPDLHANLTAAAKERGLSLNHLCVRLLTESVPRLIPVRDLLLTRPREDTP